GCPETRQRMPVQLEERHAVTDVLRGFGVELLDLAPKLLQRGAVCRGNGGEVRVDAFILLGGSGHNRSIKTEGTAPVPKIPFRDPAEAFSSALKCSARPAARKECDPIRH